MRIGIDVRPLMNKNYSGVSWYAFNLLKALFELDKENQYLLFYNSSKKVDLPEFNQDNVKYVSFRYPNKLFNLSLVLFGWPKVDKLIGGVDYFLVPNLHFISLSNQCKKIMVVHDLSFIRFPEFFSWQMRLWHRLVLRGKILKQADYIIADSKNTKNDLINLLRITENIITVAYLGVDNRFKPVTPDDNRLGQIKLKYNLPDKFILYLGTLEPRKNIESIIEAYDSQNSDYYLLIGGNKGWKTKRIYELAQENDKIKLLGYIDEKDKPILYNLATCLIYPSYYEGFGLPLLEAMACGCPVIAGNNSSQGEVVGQAGLLVDPYNINEIKQGIELILNNYQLRERLIHQGLERAQSFRWENTAKQILELFN